MNSLNAKQETSMSLAKQFKQPHGAKWANDIRLAALNRFNDQGAPN